MASANVPLCGEQLRSSLCWPETGNTLRLMTLRGVVTSQHNICGRSATSDSARWWKGSYYSVFVWVWTSTRRIFPLSNMLYSPASLPPSLQSPVCVVGVFLFPEHIRFLHHSTALQPSTTHTQRHGHKRQCGCISFFFILISVHAHTDTQIEYLNQEDLLRLTESVGWCHFCFVSVTTVLNHANSCCSVFGLHRRLREIFQGFSPKAVAEKESLTVNHNPWAVSLDSIHLLDFTH